MLTHISIENFKGIRDRVEIDLKPITLLFGPNSAGKSTILHALLYAQEVFERHNLNADTTEAGGPFINFGGFKQMVHGHNLDRPIHLGFRFCLDADELTPYKHDVDAFEVVLETNAEQIIGRPRSAGVVVAIHWSKHCEPPRPVVKSCLVQLDDHDFARFIFDDASHERRLKLLALDHPLFHRPTDRGDGLAGDAAWPRSQPESQDHSLYDTTTGDPLVCAETSLQKPKSIFHRAFDCVASLFPGATKGGFLLARRERDDALPNAHASIGPIDTLYDRDARDFLGRRLTREWYKTGCKLPPREGLEQYARNVDAQICQQRMAFDIAAFLDKTITEVLQALRRRLRDFTYLGPVREIPSRHASPPETPDPSRWSTGLGAWDYLQSCDEGLVREVSDWLSAPDKFNTGVSLERRELIYAAPPARRGKTTPRTRAKVAGALSTIERRLVIVPSGGNLDLGLYDVGVGIAQLLPAIVAALAKSAPFSGIEQPELHLHPAAQVVVGDLLIAGTAKRQRLLLVETHSEHLLLRLLRRIRETSDGNLPPGHPGLRSDQLAVFYVKKKEHAASVTPLHVTNDGDFAGYWPDGFFDERTKELF